MADSKQFGSPKILQFGDKTGANQPDSGHCAQCEAMLADALDGTLSPADQKLFDVHMDCCTPCSQMLADARRGIAWLEMLRTPKPQPPAALLERILAQTSGAQASQVVPQQGFAGATLVQPQTFDDPAAASGYSMPTGPAYGNIVPFPRRMAAAFRASAFGQIALQPRLAMTAAMAFFSIALTMDLTGVRLQNLSANDLKPSSLKRAIADTKARVVRSYEGLRVVYVLESRVHELQNASDNDSTTGTQSTPQSTTPSKPTGQSPTAKPDQPGQNGPANQSPATQPDKQQRSPVTGPSAGPAPNPGSSRREGSARPLSLATLVATLVVSDRLHGGRTNVMAASSSFEGVQGELV